MKEMVDPVSTRNSAEPVRSNYVDRYSRWNQNLSFLFVEGSNDLHKNRRLNYTTISILRVLMIFDNTVVQFAHRFLCVRWTAPFQVPRRKPLTFPLWMTTNSSGCSDLNCA